MNNYMMHGQQNVKFPLTARLPKTCVCTWIQKTIQP